MVTLYTACPGNSIYFCYCTPCVNVNIVSYHDILSWKKCDASASGEEMRISFFQSKTVVKSGIVIHVKQNLKPASQSDMSTIVSHWTNYKVGLSKFNVSKAHCKQYFTSRMELIQFAKQLRRKRIFLPAKLIRSHLESDQWRIQDFWKGDGVWGGCSPPHWGGAPECNERENSPQSVYDIHLTVFTTRRYA